ncbi:MAG: RNA polymerase sigma factor [Bacteroidota bacterium]
MQLISACKRMDRRAQRKLMDRIATPLYSVSLRYARNSDDAHDILQEALINIFSKLDQFKGNERGFRYWCNRIVINLAISKYRKANYQQEVALTENILQPSAPPKVLDELQAEDILRLLDHLPDTYRQVFNLYVVDGYKHREIADMLNIKESSSRTFLTRAKKQLQKLIEHSERYIKIRQ